MRKEWKHGMKSSFSEISYIGRLEDDTRNWLRIMSNYELWY
jgi:hypothetical protein